MLRIGDVARTGQHLAGLFCANCIEFMSYWHPTEQRKTRNSGGKRSPFISNFFYCHYLKFLRKKAFDLRPSTLKSYSTVFGENHAISLHLLSPLTLSLLYVPTGLLIDFTLSNARRFYSSTGNPLGVKGLMVVAP